MSEIELTTTPTLTLDPFQDAPTFGDAAQAKEEPKEKPIPDYDDSMLNEAEKKMVEDFSKQIDITNSSQVLQYGAGAQQKVASFSEKALENVKTKDLGEVGNMIAGVVTELKSFDVDEEEKGIANFFKKKTNKMIALKAKYEKAETNVNKIVDILEDHQVTLLKDVATLDQLYQLNLTYYKELTLYILAGKKKLHEVETVIIPELTAKAAQTGSQEDAQAVSDMSELANRFDKKLHDLELTRIVSMQMGPQIRLVQNSDVMMSDKIQSTIVNTIPLWKSQMVIAMGVEHSAQAAKAQNEVTELTNEMLKKNAQKLKTASVNVAKASERGVVDVETLKATNEQLIATLDEVQKIQTEGRAKRRNAEMELAKIEQDMKQKLIDMHKMSK